MNRRSKDVLTRRQLLDVGVRLSVGGAVALFAGGCERGASLVCNAPDHLSDAELGLRASLAYTEKSDVADQTCRNCGFFEPAAPRECGTCKLLKGPVHPGGRCNSWSAASSPAAEPLT